MCKGFTFWRCRHNIWRRKHNRIFKCVKVRVIIIIIICCRHLFLRLLLSIKEEEEIHTTQKYCNAYLFHKIDDDDDVCKKFKANFKRHKLMLVFGNVMMMMMNYLLNNLGPYSIQALIA